jgi:hypothetical protein
MAGNSSQIAINARERLCCEYECRRGKFIVRLVRLKPNAAGELHPACQPLEFAARHLPAVIAMLHGLQESEAGNE